VKVGFCLDGLRPDAILPSVVDELVDNCLLGAELAISVKIILLTQSLWSQRIDIPLCLFLGPKFPCDGAVIVNNFEELFVNQGLYNLQDGVYVCQPLDIEFLDVLLLYNLDILIENQVGTSIVELVF